MSGRQVFRRIGWRLPLGVRVGGCAHDVYHMMYTTCRVSARVDGGNASAVVAHLRGHTILLPYLRGEIDEKVWDATSTYEYGGPIWTPSADQIWSRISSARFWTPAAAPPASVPAITPINTKTHPWSRDSSFLTQPAAPTGIASRVLYRFQGPSFGDATAQRWLRRDRLGLTPDGGHLTGGTAGPAGRLSVCRASEGSTPRSSGSTLLACD